MLSGLFSRLLLALLWLLHFLPIRLLALVGCRLGDLLYLFARQRRKVVSINLDLCFPDISAVDRRNLAKKHFRLLGRSLLERGIFWWANTERINRLIDVSGEKHVRQALASDTPVILLAPHFLGLDAGGCAVTMRFDIVSIYSAQSNPVVDRQLFAGRSRFGDQLLLSRQDSPRATVKAMKSGRPFYYLPDLNARRQGAIFVPFFGIPAATITGLSRLAKAAGAVVIPCVTRMHDNGYRVEFGTPWDNFPTDDVEGDTARMNAWIEQAVRTMPEQYYWVHRRFKNRPPGEARFY